jgi:CheY-like chemotaxis protein/nitrogen-specific signal transduction histidine kinase
MIGKFKIIEPSDQSDINEKTVIINKNLSKLLNIYDSTNLLNEYEYDYIIDTIKKNLFSIDIESFVDFITNSKNYIEEDYIYINIFVSELNNYKLYTLCYSCDSYLFIPNNNNQIYNTSFLANISHEIRTPLNGICGMITLLEDKLTNRDQKDYLDIIKECSVNLLSIINDVLDYSKLEINKVELEIIPTNLQILVENINDIVLSNGLLSEKNLEYCYNIDPKIDINILFDNIRLKQILINLISNAIKFTDSGNILLDINLISKETFVQLHGHADTDDNSSQYLRFDIIDNGCGISKNDMNKLFIVYNQLSNITTKVHQGTGLGLSICKKIIQLMKGVVWLSSSEINKGSTFSFIIPTIIDKNVKKIDTIISDYDIDFLNSLLENKTVILVDDNMHNRIGFTHCLKKWKMNVLSFSNGEEAFQYLKYAQEDIHIGIIDICMPRMNGFMLAEKIQNELYNKHSKIPLIALSSLNDKDVYETLANTLRSKKHFDYYLLKPLKEEKLKHILVTVFSTFHYGFQYNLTNFTESKKTDNTNNTLASIRILVAEDVEINRKVLVSYLHKSGYTNIKTVFDGEQCLKELCENEYDIVLIDIKMPKYTGDEIIKFIIDYWANNNQKEKIRWKFKNKKKPYVVAITAYCLKNEKNKFLNAGFDFFISKPIEYEILTSSLNNYLRLSYDN